MRDSCNFQNERLVLAGMAIGAAEAAICSRQVRARWCTQPCLACGRSPSDAHHLKFAQQRALGRKVSDEFTVPLCRTHHRDDC